MRVKPFAIASGVCFVLAAIAVFAVWNYHHHQPKKVVIYNPTCAFKDADFCKFLNFTTTQKQPYIATITDASHPGESAQIKYANDSSYEISTLQGSSVTHDVIVSGSNQYIRAGSGPWTKNTGKPVALPGFNDTFGTPPDKQLIKVGTHNCGKAGCLLYRLVDSKTGDRLDVMFKLGAYQLYSVQITPKNQAQPGPLAIYEFQNVTVKAPM